MKYTYYLYLVISSSRILSSCMLMFFVKKSDPKTLRVLELPTSINHPQTPSAWQAGQVQGIPLMVDLVVIPGMGLLNVPQGLQTGRVDI